MGGLSLSLLYCYLKWDIKLKKLSLKFWKTKWVNSQESFSACRAYFYENWQFVTMKAQKKWKTFSNPPPPPPSPMKVENFYLPYYPLPLLEFLGGYPSYWPYPNENPGGSKRVYRRRSPQMSLRQLSGLQSYNDIKNYIYGVRSYDSS